MVDLVGRNLGLFETIANRLGGKSRPMFDAVKAFFFNRGDQLAIDHQRRGRIAVVSVDTDNVRHRRVGGFKVHASAVGKRQKADRNS